MIFLKNSLGEEIDLNHRNFMQKNTKFASLDLNRRLSIIVELSHYTSWKNIQDFIIYVIFLSEIFLNFLISIL